MIKKEHLARSTTPLYHLEAYTNCCLNFPQVEYCKPANFMKVYYNGHRPWHLVDAQKGSDQKDPHPYENYSEANARSVLIPCSQSDTDHASLRNIFPGMCLQTISLDEMYFVFGNHNPIGHLHFLPPTRRSPC